MLLSGRGRGRRSESRGARAGGEVGAVDLEDGERCVSVDLLTRRSARTAVAEVVSKGLLQLHVLETVLADPQFALLPVLVRIGRIVPAHTTNETWIRISFNGSEK